MYPGKRYELSPDAEKIRLLRGQVVPAGGLVASEEPLLSDAQTPKPRDGEMDRKTVQTEVLQKPNSNLSFTILFESV